jgi:hypothetical protein
MMGGASVVISQKAAFWGLFSQANTKSVIALYILKGSPRPGRRPIG